MKFNKEVIKSKVFWLGILGFIKVVTNGFGFEFSDELIDKTADVISMFIIAITMAFSVEK